MSPEASAPVVPDTAANTEAKAEMNKERELVLMPLFRVLDAAVPKYDNI